MAGPIRPRRFEREAEHKGALLHPGGEEPSHRSRGESRQQGLLVGERIGCGVVEQSIHMV